MLPGMAVLVESAGVAYPLVFYVSVLHYLVLYALPAFTFLLDFLGVHFLFLQLAGLLFASFCLVPSAALLTFPHVPVYDTTSEGEA